MKDITSSETLAALREQGIFSPKISPFLLVRKKERAVLGRRYEAQREHVDQHHEEPCTKFYAYARANIPNHLWHLPVGSQEGLNVHASNFLHSGVQKLVHSGRGLTLVGIDESVASLALLAKRLLEEGFPTYCIDFSELLYLTERSRNDFEQRAELDWLFSLEVLVIVGLPLQIPTTSGTQALLGLLAGRKGTIFRSTILGVLGTADHPMLPTLIENPQAINPIIAKMTNNELVFSL